MAKQPLGLDREQRLCLAVHLSMDDMQVRLNRMVRQGRTQDVEAMKQEFGDWFAVGVGELEPLLSVTYPGDWNACA
ncbi:MAG: hypothetical protein VKJ87_06045 [Synechococcus sp.]|nr:hypothetical protein [Synechococcus sp.]